MLDSSALPNVDDLGLTEAGELAYASQIAARENALQTIFGPTEPPNRIMSPGDPNLLVNWSGGGIYQYPPHGKRSSWHYVTSGLSQPDIDEDGNAQPTIGEGGERYSGFGIELVLSAKEKVAWAPNILIGLVKYLLFQETAHVILPGDRIPCGGTLFSKSGSQLSHLVATTSDEYETEILLPMGECSLVHLIGCTKAEIGQALSMGSGTAGSIVLCHVLKEMGVNYDSLPERISLTDTPAFSKIWERCKSECELEWATATSKS